jgi:class 3 adenylate cyclase
VTEKRGGLARETGAATFAALRRVTARKAAELIRNNPEDETTALELGLVDRAWLEDPGNGPISSSAPTDILQRFLERTVQQRPSKLSSLGLSAVQLLSSTRDAPGGTVQEVTVVFTDLEGFTAFTDANGDTAAIALIDQHHKLAGSAVRQWKGKIVKHLGDGLLCTFPDPDSGSRAALQLLTTAPSPLRLRAGVHCGEATVTRQDVVGHVVNVAARVCEEASGGQVMITAEVAQAINPSHPLHLGRMKSRRLKGVRTPVTICQVSRPAP